MKRLLIVILCLAVVCALPLLLQRRQTEESGEISENMMPVKEETPPFDSAVTLRVLTENGVQEMRLDNYLVGVLLAEMPADFPAEALKTQAIASRTFALRQAEAHKHENANVCTDPSCCQGFSSEGSETAVALVRAAVEATDGLVMTYEDALIDATFFSCSGGRTEAAVAVWGGDIPYLQSVDSPGEEDAPRYTETLTLTAEEFAQTLQNAYPDINLSGPPQGWFGAVTYTEGGGVDTVFIGGVAVEGKALRTLLSLRSTEISFTPLADAVEITTHGFGHRVGLSQYGAKAMAENGCSFAEILTHYYQSADIKRLLCPTAEQSDVT